MEKQDGGMRGLRRTRLPAARRHGAGDILGRRLVLDPELVKWYDQFGMARTMRAGSRDITAQR